MTTSGSERTRLIWIAPKFPLGAPDGARLATCSLLRHASRLQTDVHLICLHQTNETVDGPAAKSRLGVADCRFIPRHNSILSWPLHLRTPLTFRSFVAWNVRRALYNELQRLLATPYQPTFVIFDGLHPFASLNEASFRLIGSQSQGIVYRAHNFESNLWEQCAHNAQTPWARKFFEYQKSLVLDFERRVSQNVHLIASVSEEEAAIFQNLAPRTTVSVTRIGMDFPEEGTVPPVLEKDRLDLFFVGRLDWLPNRLGLTWFLKEVWSELRGSRPEMTLTIVGSGDGRWLRPFSQMPGIKLLGSVADLRPFYEASALSIAPIFQGSGMRVKLLESARFKRSAITTSLGAEGSGLTAGYSFFRAETRDEWLAALRTISIADCRTTGLRAFDAVRSRFDGGSIAENFLRLLHALSPKADFAAPDRY